MYRGRTFESPKRTGNSETKGYKDLKTLSTGSNPGCTVPAVSVGGVLVHRDGTYTTNTAVIHTNSAFFMNAIFTLPMYL